MSWSTSIEKIKEVPCEIWHSGWGGMYDKELNKDESSAHCSIVANSEKEAFSFINGVYTQKSPDPQHYNNLYKTKVFKSHYNRKEKGYMIYSFRLVRIRIKKQ